MLYLTRKFRFLLRLQTRDPFLKTVNEMVNSLLLVTKQNNYVPKKTPEETFAKVGERDEVQGIRNTGG